MLKIPSVENTKSLKKTSITTTSYLFYNNTNKSIFFVSILNVKKLRLIAQTKVRSKPALLYTGSIKEIHLTSKSETI